MPVTFPVVQARRQRRFVAAFNPLGITGLAAWYDATRGVTATAGEVDTWADQSGNGRDLSATLTTRPITGTRTQNGKNVIDFDGSNDLLDASSAFTQGTSDTVFVVCLNDDGADSTTQTVYNSDNGAAAECRLNKMNTNVWRATSGASLDGGIPDTAAHLLVGVYNGTTGSSLRLDGTELATGSLGTNSSSAAPRVGATGAGGNFWDGWVAEILHYDNVLTAANILRVENYLTRKWGL